MNPYQLSKALRKIAARIDNSKRPMKEMVVASIIGAVRNINANDDLDWLEPLSESSRGSDLMWHAFKSIGHPNWNDQIDDNAVIKEIKNVIQQNPNLPMLGKLLNDAVEYTKENYATYLKLKESGEV